jgi:hypothetical protein
MFISLLRKEPVFPKRVAGFVNPLWKNNGLQRKHKGGTREKSGDLHPPPT